MTYSKVGKTDHSKQIWSRFHFLIKQNEYNYGEFCSEFSIRTFIVLNHCKNQVILFTLYEYSSKIHAYVRGFMQCFNWWFPPLWRSARGERVTSAISPSHVQQNLLLHLSISDVWPHSLPRSLWHLITPYRRVFEDLIIKDSTTRFSFIHPPPLVCGNNWLGTLSLDCVWLSVGISRGSVWM